MDASNSQGTNLGAASVDARSSSSKPAGAGSSALGAMQWMVFCNGLNLVARLACLLVLSRILSSADFGNYSLAITSILLLDLFVFLGIGPSLIQLEVVDRRHYETATAFFILSALVVGSLAAIVAQPLATVFSSDTYATLLWTMSIGLLIKASGMTHYYFLTRNMRFRAVGTAEVVSYVGGYALTALLLGYLGFGVWSLAVAYVVEQVFLAIQLRVFAGQHWIPRIHNSALRETFSFSAGITLARMSNYVARNGDYLVIGLLAAPSVVGIYSRSYAMMQIFISSVVDAIEKVSFPAIAKVRNQPEIQSQVLTFSWRTTALVYLPLGCFCCLFAEEIILLSLGQKWRETIPVFQIFAATMIFRASYKTAGSIMRANGRAYALWICQAIYALAVILGTYFGFRWGLSGAAYGVGIALVVNFLTMNLTAAKIVNASVKELGYSLLSALPFCLCPLLAKASVWKLGDGSPLLTGTIGLLVYILALVCGLLLSGYHRWFIKTRQVLRSI